MRDLNPSCARDIVGTSAIPSAMKAKQKDRTPREREMFMDNSEGTFDFLQQLFRRPLANVCEPVHTSPTISRPEIETVAESAAFRQ